MREDVVTVYDERGREIHISRDEWETRVLPANLRCAWSDADALYHQIIAALDKGFGHAVLDAALRLAEIDPIPERAAVVLGVIETNNGMPDAAEATLGAYIDAHGESGVVLASLAQVYQAQGRDELVESTLKRGLRLEPNQEQGLRLWARIQEERGGERAWIRAMEEVARCDGAWLPQLCLGRRHLDRGCLPEALALLGEVARTAPPQSDALLTISGDLGEAELYDEMLALLLPLYDPEQHHPFAGMNLARACLMVDRTAEGRALVRALLERNLPPFAEPLAELERELARAEAPRPLGETPEISILAVEVSVWSRCMGEPEWLFPLKSPRSTRVLLSSLADATRGGRGHLETATKTGRFTRSLPLYLLESLQLRTNARAACALPAVPGQGLVVFGAPWAPAHLATCEFEGRAPDIIVTGQLGRGSIQLDLYDVTHETCLERISVETQADFFGAALRVEDALLDALHRHGIASRLPRAGALARPAARHQDAYLLGLGQLLDQVLVAHQIFDRDTLWNERAMFETCFDLAEQTKLPSARLMALCSFCAGTRYGSPQVSSYARSLKKLLAAEQGANSPLDRLSPLAYLRLGDKKAHEAACDRLSRGANTAYRRWLAALSA